MNRLMKSCNYFDYPPPPCDEDFNNSNDYFQYVQVYYWQ